jgi:hypothetical protein
VQENAALPENIGVVSVKVSVNDLHDIHVTLCNASDVDVVIKKKSVIADVVHIDAEYDVYQLLHDVKADVAPNPCQTQDEKKSGNFVQFKFGNETPKSWQESFGQKLQSFQDIFIKDEFDIGKANIDMKFEMDVQPGGDIKQRARPLAPQDFEDCRKHIQGLLDAKIIRPSCSPYASPIVLVRKKSGALRMCVDYRRLKSRTVRDSYCIPKIEDLFLTLSQAKYFSSMDLCKAYYQVPMTDKASKLSAFITPFGLFEWDRLPQGLCNAPACFQRIMETVFRDMNLVELIVFLDDILVHAKTLEELEDRTVHVLQKLRHFNLKLDPDKCIFGATEVKHLGYIISEGSIRPDPEKVSSVTTWPKPRTVKDVKRFTGFCGVYRRFIPGFADVIRPLNDLTIGYVPTKCLSKHRKQKESVIVVVRYYTLVD